MEVPNTHFLFSQSLYNNKHNEEAFAHIYSASAGGGLPEINRNSLVNQKTDIQNNPVIM